MIGDGVDDLYMELWKLCAGPLVEVPRANERVYYFPQGHMEQASSFFSFFHIFIFLIWIGFFCFFFIWKLVPFREMVNFLGLLIEILLFVVGGLFLVGSIDESGVESEDSVV